MKSEINLHDLLHPPSEMYYVIYCTNDVLPDECISESPDSRLLFDLAYEAMELYPYIINSFKIFPRSITRLDRIKIIIDRFTYLGVPDNPVDLFDKLYDMDAENLTEYDKDTYFLLCDYIRQLPQ